MFPGARRPVKVLLTAVGILAISGATAGLLGIGGALIFNPFLLQLGMDPRVSFCSCNWVCCVYAVLGLMLLLVLMQLGVPCVCCH